MSEVNYELKPTGTKCEIEDGKYVEPNKFSAVLNSK